MSKKREAKRIILVGDQVVFIMNDGTVQHQDGTNELVEAICKKNTPVIASTKID